MALGVLYIMNIIIVLGVIIAQFFLYKDRSSMKFFMINLALGVLLSFLVFTSLPTNYTGQKMFALVLGVLPFVGLYLKTQDKNDLLARVLLSVAIFGNLIQFLI